MQEHGKMDHVQTRKKVPKIHLHNPKPHANPHLLPHHFRQNQKPSLYLSPNDEITPPRHNKLPASAILVTMTLLFHLPTKTYTKVTRPY